MLDGRKREWHNRRRKWYDYFERVGWYNSCVLGLNHNQGWGVYNYKGNLLNEKRWQDIRVVYDYLILIDKDGKYSLGHIKDKKLNIIASDLRYISCITEDKFELTNEQYQKAICVKGEVLIEYGRYKDFDYEVEFDSETGLNHVEIIGLKIPRTVRWKDIVQQSEKGYVVKDGDDYAFYDTNGEMVLDFEYQDIKLLNDHVEATKKVYFD